MSALSGYVSTTKGDLLRFDNSGSGLTSSLQTIKDGSGFSSIWKLSLTQCGADNLIFSGNTITTGTGAITVNSSSGTMNFGTATGAIVTLGNTTGTTNINGTVTFGGSVSYTNLTLSGTVQAAHLIGTSDLIVAGSTITFVGAHAFAATLSGDTVVTFPTSGTLSTRAGTETLTNKTLTAPVISTITNTGTVTLFTASDTVVGRATTDTLTNKTLTTPTLTTPVINGTITGTTIIPLANGGSGYANSQQLVQRVVSTITGTSGTSNIPLDNSIPQISEGSQAATATITPKNSSNKLRIKISTSCGNSTASGATNVLAIFQDSTANAISGTSIPFIGTGGDKTVDYEFEMVAGTTSSTTFSLRIGSTSDTWTIGSTGAVTTLGGVRSGTMVIYEYTP